MQWSAGSLVRARGRDWVALPGDAPDLVRLKPLTGPDDQEIGVYLPLERQVESASFPRPDPASVADGVAAAEEHAGGALDCLVSNAAYGVLGAVEEVDLAEVREDAGQVLEPAPEGVELLGLGVDGHLGLTEIDARDRGVPVPHASRAAHERPHAVGGRGNLHRDEDVVHRFLLEPSCTPRPARKRHKRWHGDRRWASHRCDRV